MLMSQSTSFCEFWDKKDALAGVSKLEVTGLLIEF